MDLTQISSNCKFLTDKTEIPCKLNILKNKILIIPSKKINEVNKIIKFDNLNKIFINIRQREISFFTSEEIFKVFEIKEIKLIKDFIKETIINNYPNCSIKIDKIRHNERERRKHQKKILSSLPKEAYLFFILLIIISFLLVSNFSSIIK